MVKYHIPLNICTKCKIWIQLLFQNYDNEAQVSRRVPFDNMLRYAGELNKFSDTLKKVRSHLLCTLRDPQD